MGQEGTLNGAGCRGLRRGGVQSCYRDCREQRGLGLSGFGEHSRESGRKEPAMINGFDKLGKARKSLRVGSWKVAGSWKALPCK